MWLCVLAYVVVCARLCGGVFSLMWWCVLVCVVMCACMCSGVCLHVQWCVLACASMYGKGEVNTTSKEQSHSSLKLIYG